MRQTGSQQISLHIEMMLATTEEYQNVDPNTVPRRNRHKTTY